MNMNPLQFDWEDIIADAANHAANGAGPMLPVPPLPFHDPNSSSGSSDSEIDSEALHSHSSSSSGDSSDGEDMHGRTLSGNRSAMRFAREMSLIPMSAPTGNRQPLSNSFDFRAMLGLGSSRDLRSHHGLPVASTSRWLPTHDSMSNGSAFEQFTNDLELTPRAVSARAANAFGAGPSTSSGAGPSTSMNTDGSAANEQGQQASPAVGTPVNSETVGTAEDHSTHSGASTISGSQSTWNSDKRTAMGYFSDANGGAGTMSESEQQAAPLEPMDDQASGQPMPQSSSRGAAFCVGRAGEFLRPTASSYSPFLGSPALPGTSGAAQTSAFPVASTSYAAGYMASSSSADALRKQLATGNSDLVQLNDRVLSLSLSALLACQNITSAPGKYHRHGESRGERQWLPKEREIAWAVLRL